MVCMMGRIGQSKNFPTFRNALLWVRPMNFWPTRQTLMVSGISLPFQNMRTPSIVPLRQEAYMTPNQIASLLSEKFGGKILAGFGNDKHPRIHIDANDLREIAQFML